VVAVGERVVLFHFVKPLVASFQNLLAQPCVRRGAVADFAVWMRQPISPMTCRVVLEKCPRRHAGASTSRS
jgi:hypothetical protein